MQQGRYKLMVVDDSNLIRNKIQKFCVKENIAVVADADNARSAIEKFKQCRPDIVTMDLTMPGMDGIECIRNLISINNEVSILVISALADKATALEALKEGACGFLCKPFDNDDLNNAITELLS